MSTKYDVVTVGGGLAGSTLARSLALEGKRVLVLERETQFRDRVRGEQLASWGAGEANELGVYDLLRRTCANEMGTWDVYMGPNRVASRDLARTTPSGLPNLAFFHPEMQETLLESAVDAGAEVRRGATVRGVVPGQPPSVTFEHNGDRETVEARIVVGADGRGSMVRKWASFEDQSDPERLYVAGVLLDGVATDEHTGRLHINPMAHRHALAFPQGGGRIRSYLVFNAEEEVRYQGERDAGAYIEACIATGLPPDAFENATAAGPLATFSGADSYVPHPYQGGIALIGDAASTSDPSWGQGLSLTLHDVRLLRDALLSSDDWEAAGNTFAEQHGHDYAIVHETEDWFTRLFHEAGPEADRRRATVLPRTTQTPDYLPDTFQSGPQNVTISDERRKEIFGE